MTQESPNKAHKGAEDKTKQEIFKIYNPLPDFRYGVWINASAKIGFRHKPVDFGETGI